ncbi:MAG: hypothetical protein L3J41_05945 [Melioribacteraceae bacterium]|nr:hypothetical protein [Melioribacteraceae bacterium]
MILCSSLLAQLPHDSLTTVFGKEYFPFNKKIELVFDSNMGETIKNIKVHDEFYEAINVSDKFTYSQKFIMKNDGIYIIQTIQNIDIFLYSADIDITYSEPIRQIPFPLQIGDAWSWSGYQIKNGDTTSISLTGNAIAEETIELQAGKFKTLKIKLFFEEIDGEKTTLYQWLAPGLGIVKMKAIIEGSGIVQIAMALLGYDEIDSELIEIRYLE